MVLDASRVAADTAHIAAMNIVTSLTAFISTVAYLVLRTSMRIPWNTMNLKRNALAATTISVPLFLLDSQLKTMGLTPPAVAVVDLASLRFLKLLDREDLELLRSCYRKS